MSPAPAVWRPPSLRRGWINGGCAVTVPPGPCEFYQFVNNPPRGASSFYIEQGAVESNTHPTFNF
jgi:hypothetical protein